MELTPLTMHQLVFTGITTLLFFQALILFIRCHNNRVRKTMAYLELLWAATYGLALLLVSFVFPEQEFAILREKVLIVGNLFITFTHFFPIQVLLPGWLNWKRGFLLILPILVLAAIYYGVMFLLGETPEVISSLSMLWDSIGHFNVWFRFVMLFSNVFYIVVILIWLYGYEKRYIQWKNENFADQDYVDISWMRFYDYLIIGIFIFYLGILFLGGHISVICHGIYLIFTFSFFFYKSLFYESPYPEDFFADSSLIVPQEEPVVHEEPVTPEVENLSEQSFKRKTELYKQQIEQWMEEEKPFLYHDFKLTDVAHLLPLNRTYLSRVFNEGFGHNFSEVVRSYRVDYAKKILENDPSIPTHKIADLCGFHSDSAYIKAFKQVTGMTPSQYRGRL